MAEITRHGRPVRTLNTWYFQRSIVCPKCNCEFILTQDDMAPTTGISSTDVLNLPNAGITMPLANHIKWTNSGMDTVTYTTRGDAQMEYTSVYGSCPECGFVQSTDRLWTTRGDDTLSDSTNNSWEWAMHMNITYAKFIVTEAKEYIVLGLDAAQNLLYGFDPIYPSRVWTIYQNDANRAIYIGANWTPEAHYTIMTLEDILHYLPELYNYLIRILGLQVINPANITPMSTY